MTDAQNQLVAAPAAAFQGKLQETVRESLDKSLAESRATYFRAKAATDEAVNAFEASAAAAVRGVVAFNSQAIDALRANIDASLALAKAAINAKSVGEWVSAQSDHARSQAEAIAAQAKSFGDLAQKIAADTAEPIKAQVAKTFKLPG